MASHRHYANLLFHRKFHEVGSTEESPEFIIRIFPEQYRLWKKDHGSVPLAEVVDSWEVFISRTGSHTGILDRPSHDSLQKTFGTTRFEDIFAYMAEHGQVKECSHHGDLEGTEKGAYMGK